MRIEQTHEPEESLDPLIMYRVECAREMERSETERSWKMNRSLKSLSAILLVVVMLAGAGCGENSGKNTGKSSGKNIEKSTEGVDTGVLRLFPLTFGKETVVQTIRTGEIGRHLGSLDVDTMFPQYFGFGIFQEKVTTYQHCNGVTFASGTFSAEEVKSVLRERSYQMTKRGDVEIYHSQGGSGACYGFMKNFVMYTDSDEKLNQVLDTAEGKADSLGSDQALADLARAARYTHFIVLSNRPIGQPGLKARCYSGDLTAANTMRFQALFKFDRPSDAESGIGLMKPLIGDLFRKHKAAFAEWKAYQKADMVVIELTATGDMKAITADMLTE